MKKQLKDLNLLDRFLFAEAIEDPDILELMLEIILGKEIVLDGAPQAEKEIRKEYWGKRVRMDVLSEDIDRTVYNVEVQKEDTGNLPKRSRVYQGMIDSKLMMKGDLDYNTLNELYIIMIMPFDLFGKGWSRYDFSMLCENDSNIKLQDGAKRIFLNTHGKKCEGASDDLIALLQYIESSNSETAVQTGNEKVMQIHRKINAIKENDEVGVKYMNAYEEKMFDIQAGKEAGRAEAQLEIARNLKKEGIPIDVIARNTGLSEEEIENI